MVAIEDCVELTVRGLEVYFHGGEERLLESPRGDRVDGLEAASVSKKAKNKKRLQDWEEKAVHGQYFRQTKEVRSEKSWVWLQNGDLKRETESLIVTAHNQGIRTNLVKSKINKRQKDMLCRLCKKAAESIDHVVSCYSKLAQKEYFGDLLESVILNLVISGLNMSQKVF